jgi:hypothetical protein
MLHLANDVIGQPSVRVTAPYHDIEHYRGATEAIRQTVRLMELIDRTFPAWPM